MAFGQYESVERISVLYFLFIYLLICGIYVYRYVTLVDCNWRIPTANICRVRFNRSRSVSVYGGRMDGSSDALITFLSIM